MGLIDIVPDALNGLLYGLGINKNIKLEGLGRTVASLLGKPDYPGSIVVGITEHPMHIAKVPPEVYFSNGRVLSEASYWVYKWYGIDYGICSLDIYNTEAEALGAKMVYGKESMPTLDFRDHLIKKPEDLDKIKTPIEADWGRVRYKIDITKWNGKLWGLPLGMFCAPFSLACALRSYPVLMRDMRKNPEFTHRLFKWIVDDVLVPYVKLLSKETGTKIFLSADLWAAFPNITPEIAYKWLKPYNMMFTRACAKEGIFAFIVGTGFYAEEVKERFNFEIVKKGWDAIVDCMLGAKISIPVIEYGGYYEWPYEKVQEYALKNGIPIFGKLPIARGIHSRAMMDGPPEKIASDMKHAIDIMGREGRFPIIMWSIPTKTPPEHVHASSQAIKTYGKYPIAKDLDKIEFKMPEFEPFEKWIKKQDTDYPWW